MKLVLFNSLTKKEDELDLTEKKKITIYLCGPTVYDHLHVGNMRSIILFDLLRRLLESLGKEIEYVNNITDIDDKIINKSKELGKSEREVADGYVDAFFLVLSCFNIKTERTTFVRVTDYLEEIKIFIKRLEEKGITYEDNGDILFNLKKTDEWEYGKLSGQKIANLQQKNTNLKKPSRVYDFALWKKTTEGKKWESEWGLGRPGWHTECVVFIDKIFNHRTIDIHGGGIDLQFPHHENERVQYLVANGRELSNIWLHIAHIHWKKEKMSKSLGNVIYAKDFHRKYGANVLRYIIFSSHYKQTINLNDSLINNSLNYLKRLVKLLKRLKVFCYLNAIKLKEIKKTLVFEEKNEKKESFYGFNGDFRDSVINVLLKDLDTAGVFFYLEKLVVFLNKKINNKKYVNNGEEGKEFLLVIYDYIWLLDLLGMSFSISLEAEYSEQEKSLIDNWIILMKEKRFLEADKYRNELIKGGVLP